MQNKRKGLLTLLIVITILLFINPKTINYLKAKTGPSQGNISTIKEIETSHSSQIVYEKLDSGLLQYWEGVLIYYNSVGEQKWSMNLGIKRPVIKTNSNSIYVIDENKNQIICINKDGQQVYKKTLDKSYKNFNICDDNYVVLHHDTNSPVQYITIMNEQGNKTGEITLAEGQVTNLAVSKAHAKIAISTIGISGHSLENNISIYDLQGNLISVENLKNNIILDIFYKDKGNLFAVDEKDIYSIGENNEVNWKTDFNEKVIHIDKKSKDYVTVHSKGSKKNSIIYSPNGNKIRVIGNDGKLIGEVKTNEDILGLDSYKNDILSYSLRTIYKYNKNGDIKFEYPYSSDILKVFMLSDKNIVVITKEKITFLTYNKVK